MELRAAGPGDTPAIEQLLASQQLPTVGNRDGSVELFVTVEGGRVVGAIGLEVRGAYALLRSAVVDPGRRGQGIGRALVARVLAEARARGLRAVYLLTTTAERYFPAFGFVPTDRAAAPAEMQATDEFAHACEATAVAMVLPLEPTRGP
ncbi:MAG TPA: arsenic resistance N-acetyltransferase ArsN2 [Gemmatimonadales bacterium]|nr:arsenic resistance N-acetyltransferase ArsN2 [Gemmatimonadales bacterium]